MALKPQDVAVVLQISRSPSKRPPYQRLASALWMSPSEVHAAVQRAQISHLLHGPELGERPNLTAIEEFLVHGLKYVFPAERGELTRGIPTSYAAEPLRRLIVQGNEPPPVWPCVHGKLRGILFEPLYKNAPEAALRDPGLYELLALVDALREGRARERKLAEEILIKRLRSMPYD